MEICIEKYKWEETAMSRWIKSSQKKLTGFDYTQWNQSNNCKLILTTLLFSYQ